MLRLCFGSVSNESPTRAAVAVGACWPAAVRPYVDAVTVTRLVDAAARLRRLLGSLR